MLARPRLALRRCQRTQPDATGLAAAGTVNGQRKQAAAVGIVVCCQSLAQRAASLTAFPAGHGRVCVELGWSALAVMGSPEQRLLVASHRVGSDASEDAAGTD